jgi:hypothetical protein
MNYPQAFDPRIVLDSPDFKVLPDGAKPERDASKNLGLCYNQHKQIRERLLQVVSEQQKH